MTIIPLLDGPRVVARSCKDDRLVSVVSYSPNDQYIHLTLWDGDFCLDRVSLPLRRFLDKLEVPFHTDNFDRDIMLAAKAEPSGWSPQENS